MSAPRCPQCGSADIVEWNTVLVPYPVESVDYESSVAEYPADYSGSAYGPVWDTAEVIGYGCRSCTFGAEDARVFLPGHAYYVAAAEWDGGRA